MTVSNPKLLLESIGNIKDPAVQETVHGLDLTVLNVLEHDNQSNTPFVLDFDNSARSLPKMVPRPMDGRDYWILDPHTTHVIVYNEYIKIPSLHCGIVLPRSTLLRGGACLHSALWDAGYEGRGTGLLTIGPVPLELRLDARVGQMIFLKADAEKTYDGTYQRERTRIWTDGGVSKKGAQCTYMVEGEDGVVVFPLPKGTTSNQAEYMGIIKALSAVRSYEIELITDSKLACNQINTRLGVAAPREDMFECRSNNLQPLLNKVICLCDGRKVRFTWMSREHNKAHSE